MNIDIKEFVPLTSHQVGIKIRELILKYIKESDDQIVLDFNGVDICTDSFSQHLTTILAKDIGFNTLKERIRYKNLNSFLQEMIKGNLYKALKNSEDIKK